MKALIVILIIFVPFLAFAQGKEIPKSALKELSEDLAAIHQQILQIQRAQFAGKYRKHMGPCPADKFTVTQENTQIRAGATITARPLRPATMGESFKVVDKVNDWYAVAFDKPVGNFYTGWMNAAEGVPAYTDYTAYGIVKPVGGEVITEPVRDTIFRSLTETVTKLRDKYRDNPYFFVKGFSIEVGIPPSVSVDFEFR